MRQLYACLIDSTEKDEQVFHASYVEGKGRELTIGTSQILERGNQLYLAPLPDNWNGESLSPNDIRTHADVIVANVARAETRGRYRLTCLSEKDRQNYLAVRSGYIRDDEFSLESKDECGITTVVVKGKIGFGSANKIKAVLERIIGKGKPILLDMRETAELSSLGLSSLVVLLKEIHHSKSNTALLVDPKSRIMRTLTLTRIGELVKIYSKPELAKAVLFRSSGAMR